MKPHPNSKLNQRQQEQSPAATQSGRRNTSAAASGTPLEFSHPEQLLQHDASRIELPPGIAARLQESIRQEPPPPRSWWQRLIGG